MIFKLIRKFGQRFVGPLLVLVILVGSYSPAMIPRAEAQFVVVDIFQRILDTINKFAPGIAQAMIDRTVKSTIKWANTGFQGNPAFVTNTGQFYGDIASGVIGDAILSSEFGFLCSPFQAQVRLSLIKEYTDDFNPQCTLQDIGVNIDNFYQDFNQGGWEAWLKLTQEEQNNPYGAYVSAKLDIDRRIVSAIGLKQEELLRNNGVKDLKICNTYNTAPPTSVLQQYERGEIESLPPPYDDVKYYNPARGDGECLDEGRTKTPGTVIKQQLDNVLPTGINKLVSVQTMDQLVGAFAAGLLNRYVFGSKGLLGDGYADHFSKSSKSNSKNGGYDWKFCARLDQFCTFSGSETVRLRWREWDGLGVRNMSIWYPPDQSVPNTSKKTKEMDFSNGVKCTEEAFELEKGFNERDVVGTPWCEIVSYISQAEQPAPPPVEEVPQMICAPEIDRVSVGEIVRWNTTTTYPLGTFFGWAGDEITTSPRDNRNTNTFIDIYYAEEGVKFAEVTVFDEAGGELRSVQCSKQVTVVAAEEQ